MRLRLSNYPKFSIFYLQLLMNVSPETSTAPNSAKTAATATSDLKRFLRRSGVSLPPSEERLRSLAFDACSSHLDSARDCSDPALALAAMALTVCPGAAFFMICLAKPYDISIRIEVFETFTLETVHKVYVCSKRKSAV